MGSSGCFKDSSTILNKNVTNITGLGQSKIDNKNDTIYDYSNGKKFFDNSIINNINSGITMTSLAPNIDEHILTNSSMDNNQNSSQGNGIDQSSNVNIFADSTIQKNSKGIDMNCLDKDNHNINNKNIMDNPHGTNTISVKKTINLTEVKKENTPSLIPKKDEMNFENAKYLKHDIPITNNRRRSARKFIEQSEKAGINFITIPKKEDKEQISSVNQNNIPKQFPNNKFQFNNKDFTNSHPAIKDFHSRRGKQNTINHDNNSNKEIEHKQNPPIHLSKLLENDIPIGNTPSNNNKKNTNNGFLFGMESRRGHNLNANLKNTKNKK